MPKDISETFSVPPSCPDFVAARDLKTPNLMRLGTKHRNIGIGSPLQFFNYYS